MRQDRTQALSSRAGKGRPLFIILLCVVYIISPIDLLPELFLGPFGLVDDLGALFIAIREFKKMFRSEAMNAH